MIQVVIQGLHSILGNFWGATCQWWVGLDVKVGRVISTFLPLHCRRVSTHPLCVPDKQARGIIRVQPRIPVRQNTQGGCEAGQLRGLARKGSVAWELLSSFQDFQRLMDKCVLVVNLIYSHTLS